MYQKDKEYMAEVGHLIQHPKLQKLKEIPHHIHSNRLEHSIHVSYTSYRISKKMGWDTKSTARGALLHDLFTMIGAKSNSIRAMLGSIHE